MELLIALPQTRQFDYIKKNDKIEIGWNEQSGICFAEERGYLAKTTIECVESIFGY